MSDNESMLVMEKVLAKKIKLKNDSISLFYQNPCLPSRVKSHNENVSSCITVFLLDFCFTVSW